MTTISLLARYRQELAEAKAALDSMVANAIATKTALPNNYWQAEHEARRKLKLCIAIQEEIDGEV